MSKALRQSNVIFKRCSAAIPNRVVNQCKVTRGWTSHQEELFRFGRSSFACKGTSTYYSLLQELRRVVTGCWKLLRQASIDRPPPYHCCRETRSGEKSQMYWQAAGLVVTTSSHHACRRALIRRADPSGQCASGRCKVVLYLIIRKLAVRRLLDFRAHLNGIPCEHIM
jgi:hypothetical protein